MRPSLHRFLAILRWRLARHGMLLSGALRSLANRGIGGTAATIRRRLQPVDVPTPAAATPEPASSGGPLLLFIDAGAPTPERDSGSVRAWRILQSCRELGWQLAFMPDNGQVPEPSARLLGELGVEVIGVPGRPRLDRWLARNGERVRTVFLCRHPVARRHLPLLRAMTSAQVVFDTVDLHHVRLHRAAALQAAPDLQAEAERARREEFALIRACDATVVVSHAEHDYLRQSGVGTPLWVLSNVHDVAAGERRFEDSRDLLFVGGYQHHPNREAIAWLCEAIMPELRRRLPGVVLHLVGDIPAAAAAGLCSDDIRVHGQVPTVEPFLLGCRVSLAPLLSGAGVKGKINEAMSHGLPVVATPIAAEGMFLAHGENALIAEDAIAFAEATARLYRDGELWQRLSRNGYRNIEAHFSSALARRTLQQMIGSPQVDGPGGTMAAGPSTASRFSKE